MKKVSLRKITSRKLNTIGRQLIKNPQDGIKEVLKVSLLAMSQNYHGAGSCRTSKHPLGSISMRNLFGMDKTIPYAGFPPYIF